MERLAAARPYVAANLNLTCRVRPEARVTDARPVSASGAASEGNRARSSPMPAMSGRARIADAGETCEARGVGVNLEQATDLLVQEPDISVEHPQLGGNQLGGEDFAFIGAAAAGELGGRRTAQSFDMKAASSGLRSGLQ